MKNIVFVCIQNSCRSQMAEAFARMHEVEGVRAYSAGSAPSGQVNPKAIAAMNELGYDLSNHRSKSLDDLPDIEFDAAITMGCGDSCPNLQARLREDWNIRDPKDMEPGEFAEVRDMISVRVRELLARL